MPSIRNFFSKLFLNQKGDSPTVNKKDEKKGQPLMKRVSGIFSNRRNSGKSNPDQDESKASRRHSDSATAELTTNISCTRLSLDGTCLMRAPAYTGSSLRSSLNETTSPLSGRDRASSFAYENIRTSQLNSDHADIERRVSDRSRSSTASKRRSLLDVLLGSSTTSLRRNQGEMAVDMGKEPQTLPPIETLPAQRTHESLKSMLENESTELRREINYYSAKGLRSSLQYDSLKLPAHQPDDLSSISSMDE